MKKINKWVPVCLLFIVLVAVVWNVSFKRVALFPNGVYVDYQEIEEARNKHLFGRFIDVDISASDVSTSDNSENTSEIICKLFGFIPIRKIQVNMLPEEEVYVGGNQIGLNVKTAGVIVVSDSMVDNQNSKVVKNKYLKNGDMILSVEGNEIASVEELMKYLTIAQNEVKLEILRQGEKINVIMPLLKNSEKEFQLGVWVRDDLSGIGTLTFVREDSLCFGALGHGVTSGCNEELVPIKEGNVYNCNLVNVVKGTKNQPGELQCVFVQRDTIGTLEKNTNVGVFGCINEADGIIDANKTAKLGGRLSLSPGKAKLISSVSGINEEYDIEIIKVNYQSKSDDKSFVFRVKDKKLIELTGGIVQGMSGSPIMQNGKLVGAVTHVFISDPLKGYGVYTDWMLDNMK